MGLLDYLMPYGQTTGYGPQKTTNQFTGWLDANRSTLGSAFGGLTGASNLHDALGGWTNGINDPNAAKTDTAYQQAQQQQATEAVAVQKQQAQQSQTIQALLKAGRQDLVDYISAGGSPVDAFKTFIEDKKNKVGGPYDGTSMDAQNWNILLTGDPNSQEYAAAWAQVNQPKVTYTAGPNGLVPVMQQPNIPAGIRPPAGMSAPPVTAGEAGGISTGAPIPGTEPKLNEQQTRAQSMVRVVTPEVQSLVGANGQPGTFDSLGNGWDMAKDATGTVGRMAPFNMGTPSTDYLKAQGSIRTFVASYLYVISGATANPGEVENQVKILTPQLNDPPPILAQKRERLKTMLQAMKDAASGKPVDLNAALAGPDAGSSDAGGIDDLLTKYGQ